MSANKSIYILIGLFLVLILLTVSCGDTKKTKQVCLDYLEKAAECTISDEETREQYMYENRAQCDEISEESWNYMKIFPCRKNKDCAIFLACVEDNTSQEPESDGDLSSSTETDGDNSDICNKQCTCGCSCGDTTLVSIDNCLDCTADCETECETFCGD